MTSSRPVRGTANLVPRSMAVALALPTWAARNAASVMLWILIGLPLLVFGLELHQGIAALVLSAAMGIGLTRRPRELPEAIALQLQAGRFAHATPARPPE